MNSCVEKLEYEEKMDLVSESLEELILDALLIALQKITKRNRQFRNRSNPPKVHDIQF